MKTSQLHLVNHRLQGYDRTGTSFRIAPLFATLMTSIGEKGLGHLFISLSVAHIMRLDDAQHQPQKGDLAQSAHDLVILRWHL